MEREHVSRALDSGWLAPAGPTLDEFEGLVAQACDSRFAVAVSSGTAALHLALIAAGIGSGNRVLVPSLTFAASVFAIEYVGATPVFVDSNEESWCLDVEQVRKILTEGEQNGSPIAAVMAVDLFGRMPNYEDLEALVNEFGIPLIEDAAEALGSAFDGKSAGSFGLLRAVSFNGNKIVSAAGGGAVLTDSKELATRIRSLATQARLNVHWFEHEEVGFNYRMSNLQAAVGSAQLRRLDDLVEHRRHVRSLYEKFLNHSDSGISVVRDPALCRSNAWLTTMLLPEGLQARGLVESLHARGIEARMNWKPMHLQPVFRSYQSSRLPVSEDLFVRGICCPSGPGLSDSNIEEVASNIIDLVHGR